MALDEIARTEFVDSFARVLVTAWSSEEFSQRLVADPRAALAEAGLDVPTGGEIVIDRSAPAAVDGNIDLQVQLWERGLATGRFEFHIPDVPQVDPGELAEADLGAAASVPEEDVNCCCCPCSCC